MSQLQKEYEKFNLVSKRILKENLSINHNTLTEYRWQIIEAYNIFVKFIADNVYRVKQADQATLAEKLKTVRTKFAACLDALKCTYVLPENIYEIIDGETIGSVPVTESEIPSSATISNIQTNASREDSESERVEREAREKIQREARERAEREERERADREARERAEREERESAERQNREIIMAELKAQRELLEIVNGQIRKPYDGDPLTLQTFLTGVNIATDFANTELLKSKLVIYVTGRLEGRAREIIGDGVGSIEELVAKLKDAIKPENSKIIEARIASLHYTYSRQEEFAAKTEELADALRRTLIIEGMTPQKANEMTIDRTIQLCRKSTNSDVVKAVLCAAQFNNAKEVVAKLITSNDECVKERQILRYQKDNGRNNTVRGKFNKNRGYQNQRGGRGSYNNANNNSYGSYNNNKHYDNNNYRGKNNFKGRNNYGGRGYNQNNNRYQAPTTNNGNWRVNQNQNVRLAQSGNGPIPQTNMGVPYQEMQ